MCPLSIITVGQLTKTYGRRTGVVALDLHVGAGSVFGFLGPNGSGKTTTMRVLMGLLKATSGTARIFGLDCWRDSHLIKADVGYLPGDLRLYPWLTCHGALRIMASVRHQDLAPHGHELADDFGLEVDVPVRKMSHGMRQKLGLILALAHHPKLLILDEPTTALDPLMQEKLFSRLRSMTDQGHTVFLSSHTLSEVDRLCDRVAILREGRLVVDEPIETFRMRAGRLVQIVWREGVNATAIEVPPSLTMLRSNAGQWEATLAGPVMDLVSWCTTQPIADVSIGHPDLGMLFRAYYTDGVVKP